LIKRQRCNHAPLGDLFNRISRSIDPAVSRILERALEGKPPSRDDAIGLFGCKGQELNALIMVADELRRRTVGNTVTYVVNRNINFTNVCVAKCGFCAFSRAPDAPDRYLLSVEEIARRAEEAWRMGATEVCIQGGLHPRIDASFYAEICKTIKMRAPSIHIHAFSPMEIVHGAEGAGLSITENIRMLKEAGLDSMPGTAAEILDDQIRRIICPGKMTTKKWVEVIKTAHKLGIRTTSTIMYGHVDKPEHWVSHLALLREIQIETSGFTEFVPLSFTYPNTSIYRNGMARPGATGAEDVKMYAVSRLILNDAIRNIQVSWVKLGLKLAQLCLNAGANDFGGTLMDESISRAAGASAGQSMSAEEFNRLISDLGRNPAQRSTTYQILGSFKK